MLISSTREDKEDIRDIPLDTSKKLLDVKPVDFYRRGEPKDHREAGVILEDLPPELSELIVRTEDGKASGVRYREITPHLLNLVQDLYKQISDLQAKLEKG